MYCITLLTMGYIVESYGRLEGKYCPMCNRWVVPRRRTAKSVKPFSRVGSSTAIVVWCRGVELYNVQSLGGVEG